MRLLAAVLAGVLVVAGTAGCASDEDRYCAALRDHQAAFADMADAGGAALVDHLAMLRSLAKKAPDDLTDEWQAFVSAVAGLKEALDDAGVSPDSFRSGQAPPGVTPADAARIRDAANQLTQEDVVSAVQGIDQQARDVCKIQLGL